jgi:hypothetical protein
MRAPLLASLLHSEARGHGYFTTAHPNTHNPVPTWALALSRPPGSGSQSARLPVRPDPSPPGSRDQGPQPARTPPPCPLGSHSTCTPARPIPESNLKI